MASQLNQEFSALNISDVLKKKHIGIVVSEWNKEITNALLQGAESTLKEAGIENINIKWVPGSFELPLAAQYLLEYAKVDAVIAIGCLIKGETPHFHYISEAVTQSLSRLNLQYIRPVVYGVLTVENLEQAEERAGGKLGNKGSEAATVAIKMMQLKEEIHNNNGRKKLGF